jgi:toxin-antitoxin system PIN domain toxin
MILVDANLLIYAVNGDSPFHDQARPWWEESLSGHELVGLPWAVILAFLRVTTHRRIFDRPLEPEQALGYVDEWLNLPICRTPEPTDRHWPVLRNLLVQSGTAGNLTTDAHLAALALEHGATLCSSDNDFQRFPGIAFHNPLADVGGNGVHEDRAAWSARG